MDTRRILLIDDDEEDQRFFMEALKTLNLEIECKTAGNGQEAIDQLELSFQYEIIFLDLNMPVMNGFECLEFIRRNEKYKHIPVVIFTTSVNHDDKQFCEGFGIKRYFHKPNSFPKLCLGLYDILGNRNVRHLFN
jgi:CheY-like chemotaxis protein